MKKNSCRISRSKRIIFAIALMIAVIFVQMSSELRMVLIAIAVIALITGSAGH